MSTEPRSPWGSQKWWNNHPDNWYGYLSFNRRPYGEREAARVLWFNLYPEQPKQAPGGGYNRIDGLWRGTRVLKKIASSSASSTSGRITTPSQGTSRVPIKQEPNASTNSLKAVTTVKNTSGHRADSASRPSSVRADQQIDVIVKTEPASGSCANAVKSAYIGNAVIKLAPATPKTQMASQAPPAPPVVQTKPEVIDLTASESPPYDSSTTTCAALALNQDCDDDSVHKFNSMLKRKRTVEDDQENLVTLALKIRRLECGVFSSTTDQAGNHADTAYETAVIPYDRDDLTTMVAAPTNPARTLDNPFGMSSKEIIHACLMSQSVHKRAARRNDATPLANGRAGTTEVVGTVDRALTKRRDSMGLLLWNH
ncbi:Hypothetical protein D9617_13g101290 [Elsinoe fawcettii]|nr:Hypothetical protein D9617_13g101290 [Elsinoe fawcettii]